MFIIIFCKKIGSKSKEELQLAYDNKKDIVIYFKEDVTFRSEEYEQAKAVQDFKDKTKKNYKDINYFCDDENHDTEVKIYDYINSYITKSIVNKNDDQPIIKENLKEVLFGMEKNLYTARKTGALMHAKEHLEEIIKNYKKHRDQKEFIEFTHASVIASLAYYELALLAGKIDQRIGWYKKSINVVKDKKDVESLLRYTNTIIDCFWDNFSAYKIGEGYFQAELAQAKRKLDELLKEKKILNLEYRTQILFQKSSLLRCQAKMEFDKSKKMGSTQQAIKAQAIKFADESLSCANYCIEINPKSHLSYLAKGQALQVLARFTDDKKEEAEKISKLYEAEESFFEATKTKQSLSYLALSRFYRQTYRPRKAISYFSKYRQTEENYRRLLLNSYILGESVMQLYYQNQKQLFDQMSKNVINLLNQVFDSGYKDARIVSDIALLEAAQGDIEQGKTFLKKLDREEGFDLSHVLKTMKDLSLHDGTISQAFIIGVNDSKTWNAIGTFAHDFLTDSRLAIRAYKMGLTFNPQDNVIHTNMARCYLKIGDLEEAKTSINKAEDYSDALFRWWMPLKKEIDKLNQQTNKIKEVILDQKPQNFRILQKQYEFFESIKDKSDDQFKEIFISLLEFSCATKIIENMDKYIDIVFCDAEKNSYYVKLKWNNNMMLSDEIELFLKELPSSEIRIILVSKNGFQKTTNNIHNICMFLDKNDIDKLMSGENSFEKLLDRQKCDIDI